MFKGSYNIAFIIQFGNSLSQVNSEIAKKLKTSLQYEDMSYNIKPSKNMYKHDMLEIYKYIIEVKLILIANQLSY